jgi:arsenical pump membrane protein
MNWSVAAVLPVVLLVVVLAGAVLRPWGLPEAVIAVPAAVVAIGAEAIRRNTPRTRWRRWRR